MHSAINKQALHVHTFARLPLQNDQHHHDGGLTGHIKVFAYYYNYTSCGQARHRLFPNPVGNAASTSRPRKTLQTTCSCSGYNIEYPRFRASLKAALSTCPSTSSKQTDIPRTVIKHTAI